MGLRSWLRERAGRSAQRDAAGSAEAPIADEAANGEQRPGRADAAVPSETLSAQLPTHPSASAPQDARSRWAEVPAYLPADPQEHMHACVIAAALAAGDRKASDLRVRSIRVMNPKYRRAAIIASALGAALYETTTLQVKRIFVMESKEDDHAA